MSFFFWALCCLSFNLRVLITPLVSSNSSLTNSLRYISHLVYDLVGLVLGLWCLTPLSTIFQLYCGRQFYWRRKPECPEKTPTCRKSLTNFIILCCIRVHPALAGFQLTSLVMICTDYTGSYKYNYHEITTMAALP